MRCSAILALVLLCSCAPAVPPPEPVTAAGSPTARAPIRGTRLLPSGADGVAGRVQLTVTRPVSPGETATATAQTEAGATCAITVHYASGRSEAQGLVPATANEGGTVSWSWIVGINTTPGSWPVDVECVDPEGRRAAGRALLTVQGPDVAAPTASGEGRR